MSLPRREIEEIVQLHIREGGRLQEVFVEGSEDKRFYGSFLAEQGLGHVAVLEIGTVNVPDNEIRRVGLTIGNKHRVVTLAALLEGRVADSQVVCIADADADHFKGVSYQYSLLLVTDYTSIELYALSSTVMQRILDVALHGFPKRHDQVVADLTGLLQDAFVIRVAVDDLGLAPNYPEHSSFCEFDRRRGVASFRLRDYVNKAFENYPDASWRDPLNARIEERRGQLKPEVRVQIHGHDFVATFAWYVRQHAGYGHLNAATLAETLLGFVDAGTLAKESLFRELVRRLRSAQEQNPPPAP
jgi:hypothetical protein